MKQAIETFRNWQVEILNSFVYGMSFWKESIIRQKSLSETVMGIKNSRGFEEESY